MLLLWMLPTGHLIRRTGYYKWILLIGVQLYVLGEGLMIRFRPPDHSIGWMIFTQIFIAFGDSSFTCVEEVAVLAAGSHNDSAAMLAFLSLFGYYGGANIYLKKLKTFGKKKSGGDELLECVQVAA
ncbi:hypothetical protein M231_06248 [Tremella mesenterica]|uniref:Acetyl-coenzyme A transporter 1 n=1 Tax=Tremella mesenterica TaxID=5217 RepID=A0A4Q1BEF9_TREME|nr:hypothetical protein M231_06248 [Tremella mesenterica]